VNIRSDVADIVWPALPAERRALLLAILFQLEQTQWWSPDRLREQQLRQLGALVDHAARTVPYYEHVFARLGFDPREPLNEDRWRRLPLLRRSDAQEYEADLVSRAVPRSHGPTQATTTSGATGASVRVTKPAILGAFWNAMVMREHRWHRRDLSAKLAVVRHAKLGLADPPDGRICPDWGGSASLLCETGPMVVLAIRTDPVLQAQWLVRHDPDYLLTYPSNLLALADIFEAGGLRLARLREVRTVSEAISRHVRERCTQVFGVPIADAYSTQEVGYVAIQCPEHEHYHVTSESAFVEVLDDRGESCKPGEVGRVVVTHLHNFATVLLRYDVGDYAEVGAPCSCGRGLPVITRILGRVRNMLTYPDGRRRWVNFINFKENRKVAPVRQAQIIQKSLHEIEMKLVAGGTVTEAQEALLREMLLKDLNHPFELTVSYHDELLREASGKFEDFKSLLPDKTRPKGTEMGS
jgi:phenylacetate-CoA ligase